MSNNSKDPLISTFRSLGISNHWHPHAYLIVLLQGTDLSGEAAHSESSLMLVDNRNLFRGFFDDGYRQSRKERALGLLLWWLAVPLD